MIDPELELTPIERGDLSLIYHAKGWKVVERLLRIIVEEARVAVDNAVKDEDILSAQRHSRASGVVVTKFLTRCANEVGLHGDVKKNAEPIDGAPGLEMDDITEAVKDLPNLLGEAYITEEEEEPR